MKRCITNGLTNATAVGVLALTMITLRAQDIPLTLNISVTGTVQGADDGGTPIDRIKTSTIRISTKQVLNLLASGAYAGGFPIGTRLSLSGGSVSVVDKSGNNLLPDVATINVATEVKNGQANPNTGALSHILSLALTFNFDDGNGNTFNLTGLAKGLVSLSAMDASGNQKSLSLFQQLSWAMARLGETRLCSQAS